MNRNFIYLCSTFEGIKCIGKRSLKLKSSHPSHYVSASFKPSFLPLIPQSNIGKGGFFLPLSHF